MSSKKKVKVTGKIEVSLPPEKKTYMFFSQDGIFSSVTYEGGRVTVTHSKDAWTQIVDTGSGYHIIDTTPVRGTVTYDLDYGVMADLFAALKIFYRNADKINGEYWTIFQGEKL